MSTKTIAVSNTKGGTGKTTTAMFLAACWQARGVSPLVVDLDKQGSASEWADRAESSDTKMPFRVVETTTKRMGRYIGETAAPVVIIDTPPGDAHVIDAALSVADLVVVPTQASEMDTARVWETLPFLDRRVTHAVLLTNADITTRLFSDIRNSFVEAGVSIFDAVIPRRVAIRASYGKPPPVGDLGHGFGYGAVADEIEAALV